jgi:hypothetical protein
MGRQALIRLKSRLFAVSEECSMERLIVFWEEPAGLYNVSQFGEAGAPPVVVFKDRVILR